MKIATRLIFILTLIMTLGQQAQADTVTDLLGRKVDLNRVPHRIMLADARAIEAMSIIFKGDPSASIAAWDDSLQKKSPDIMAAFAGNFADLKTIPTFANPYTTTFNVENAVARKADLVIFDIGLLAKLKDEGVTAKLDSLHIPYIFIDFRQKPLQNTVKSIELLGEVFHQQKNARQYLDFYNQRMSLIAQRTADLTLASARRSLLNAVPVSWGIFVAVLLVREASESLFRRQAGPTSGGHYSVVWAVMSVWKRLLPSIRIFICSPALTGRETVKLQHPCPSVISRIRPWQRKSWPD